MLIHPTAIIDTKAVIAADVEIGPYCVIGADVEIGASCRLGSHISIKGPTRIGKENSLFSFASIGDAPQDKKHKGEPTRLEIGDRNTFREYCTMNRGTTHDRAITKIGNDNMFLAYSHVGHDCVVGDNCVLSNHAALGGHVELGNWVNISAFAGIHQFCKVGAHAFLANNAAVTMDVPPYVMVVGQPARAHSVNSEGLKRRGFSVEQIRNIRTAFRVLYRSGLKLAQAREQLMQTSGEQPEILPLLEFIDISTRGLVR